MRCSCTLWAACLLALPRSVLCQTTTLQVSTTGGNASSPLLYGILYEDVYHSGDGGFYAELIQNRAFQGTNVPSPVEPPFQNLQYWSSIGSASISLDDSTPVLTNALPYQMQVAVPSGATGTAGFYNTGFWGFNITTATRYSASFWLRGTYSGQIVCTYQSNSTGQILASTTFDVTQTASGGWKYYVQVFTPTASAPDAANTFRLTFDAASVAGSSLYFQQISSFQQTYLNSNNGMRMDLAYGVQAINGKFLRMPGGNNMEGLSSPYHLYWNQTVGPIQDRPSYPGTWGYMNTNGFGLLELMDWCTTMNLTTILAGWAGYYLDGEVTAQADLQPFITDFLNELEFLTGSSASTYGALRAQYGYPDPFTIDYVEIGNEDFFSAALPSYIAYRFQMFHDAIKAVYPDIKIISSVWEGYFDGSYTPPSGTIQDLHDYLSVDQMVAKFSGYDNAPRNYPVLVGEYAAIYDAEHQNPNQLDNPTLQSATSEAIYFLGLERNADVIVGISHGALLKSLHDEPDNVAMMKHSPTEIVFSYSYYVAQLFANNYGSETVPISSTTNYGPLYWAGTKDDAGTYFIKVVNYDGATSTPININIPGKTGPATLKTVTGPSASSTNVLGDITSVVSETTVDSDGSGSYSFTLSGSYISAVLVV